MYISLNWLKEFINLPSKISSLDIANKLTGHTAEVEGFINQAQQFDKVVVGKVLEVKKHPNADRLRIALVDVKTEKLSIVCGAPNLEAGQLVPVALCGAVLPGDFEIKESEIRGEKSFGMICAEDELGLGNNHEGIIVLDKRARVGESFAGYLRADDTVFEIDNKSLSNRSDLLSHYGIARELSAIFNAPLKPYEKLLNRKIKFLNQNESNLDVKVEDKEACPRYLAVKIDNIEIKESPDWLKDRLVAVKQKPINNIVDLTNYVLFEIGQPLHAFSADKVKKILVRRAKDGEKIETLDEKERMLSPEDLLISNGEEGLALAGIMGGLNSGINDKTNSIILEAANFKAGVIRRTSQRLGIRTESSTRYEKSLDPLLTEIALFRFLNLLLKILPKAVISSNLVDINNTKTKEKEISLRLDWLNEKIGQEIPRPEVILNLQKLGFEIINEEAEVLKIKVPSWRATKDVSIPEDLVEEVLRLHGYDQIESRLPLEPLSLPQINEERLLQRKIKNILAWKHNLNEVYNYSFVGEDQLKKLNIDFFKHLRLVNPSSDNHSLLRQSLIPNLIANVKNNQARPGQFGFFEFGSVFFNIPGNLKREASGDNAIPYQENHLGLILAGENSDLFSELKGVIENLFKNLLGHETETRFLKTEELPGWADKKIATKISLFEKEVGFVSALSLEAINNLNLKKRVFAAEINFKELNELVLTNKPFKFKELAKYPPVSRDLAFVLEENILYNEIKEEISNFNPLLKKVELFDTYSGNKLPLGKKSLAFHLSFQAADKTLTAAEVDSIINDLLVYLEKKFDAHLRD